MEQFVYYNGFGFNRLNYNSSLNYYSTTMDQCVITEFDLEPLVKNGSIKINESAITCFYGYIKIIMTKE